MASLLATTFHDDLGCDESTAAVLADLARERVPWLGGSTEDSEEDLVLRLQDPRVFGAFAESIMRSRRLPLPVRVALAEHAFDLLPLPRTEGAVIAVDTRAPRRLLVLAAFLLLSDRLSVLHVMHLVYAVFLDRSLVTEVPPRQRSAVLRGIAREAGSGERLRALYVCLHVAALPEVEAAAEFASLLRTASVPLSLRRTLAAVAGSEDGGHAALAQLAQGEGLLPDDVEEAQSLAIVANIPRLPETLAPLSLRFLERSR